MSRAVSEMLLSAPSQQVSKRYFLSSFYIEMIILSRQARDKHRENSKKSTVFLQWIELFPFWPKKEPASFGGEDKHAKPSVSQTPSHKEFQEFQWTNPNSMLYQDRLATNVSKSLREHLQEKDGVSRAHRPDGERRLPAVGKLHAKQRCGQLRPLEVTRGRLSRAAEPLAWPQRQRGGGPSASRSRRQQQRRQ
jgi:hypothetical protein